ncbi:hypothetical protein NFI96_007394 [Prochilodus magdalenae]|nr:hypothetical protein NFI96_007394 [Prochilodus magdalenae]
MPEEHRCSEVSGRGVKEGCTLNAIRLSGLGQVICAPLEFHGSQRNLGTAPTGLNAESEEVLDASIMLHFGYYYAGQQDGAPQDDRSSPTAADMNATEGPGFFVPMSNETGVVRSPYEYPQYYLADPWVFYLLTGYMFLLIVVSFPINAFTIHVTIQYQKLRTPLNYLLLNLAMANLFMVVGGHTTTMYAAMQGYFFYGHAGCNTEAFFCVLGGQISLWTLMVLAVERWMAVCKPLKTFRFRQYHACLGVGFAWMMGFSCALPPLLEWSRYIPEGLQCSCGVDFYTENIELSNDTFIIYLFVMHFSIPLTVISFCYLCVFCSGGAASAEEPEATKKSEGEVTRMAMVMVMVFLACWLPYAGVAWYIFTYHSIPVSPFFMTALSFYAKSSTLYSPIIYVCMNKPFRDCVIRTIYNGENPFETKEEAEAVSSSSVSPE